MRKTFSKTSGLFPLRFPNFHELKIYATFQALIILQTFHNPAEKYEFHNIIKLKRNERKTFFLLITRGKSKGRE